MKDTRWGRYTVIVQDGANGPGVQWEESSWERARRDCRERVRQGYRDAERGEVYDGCKLIYTCRNVAGRPVGTDLRAAGHGY